MSAPTPRRLLIGISGASGAIYGVRLLEVLHDIPGIETHLVMSPGARQTLMYETDWKPQAVETLADVVYRYGDIAAAPSSGSYRMAGMIVAPCSMRSLSGIAHSADDNLLARAADVMLKEHRRLVLLPRESPLHLGHLRLLAQVAEMGAIVAPPLPAFYQRPRTIDDIINHTVVRVLDLFEIEPATTLTRRWTGPERAGNGDSTERLLGEV